MERLALAMPEEFRRVCSHSGLAETRGTVMNSYESAATATNYGLVSASSA